MYSILYLFENDFSIETFSVKIYCFFCMHFLTENSNRFFNSTLLYFMNHDSSQWRKMHAIFSKYNKELVIKRASFTSPVAHLSPPREKLFVQTSTRLETCLMALKQPLYTLVVISRFSSFVRCNTYLDRAFFARFLSPSRSSAPSTGKIRGKIW